MPLSGANLGSRLQSQVLRWPGWRVPGQSWFHPLLLLVWLTIGTALRFTHLTLKPLWVDEFSTLVFSLGNSYRTIPLDQVIGSDVLLQPLQPNPQAGIGRVINHLLAESNHPPVYFVLTHLWMRLFPPEEGLASIWAARSLAALLGAAAIPAMFGLGRLAFRSRLVGQLAAAMMAVSPYGIFLAQEARHYPLAILWVIASVSCLVLATKNLNHRTSPSVWVGLIWVGVNTLGVATHYFFALALCAEALVLIALGLWHWRQGVWFQSGWLRVYAVAAGTLAGSLVWLPVWQPIYGSELTQWVYSGDRTGWEWLEPVPRFLYAWITMFTLLPVDAAALPIVVVSALGMLIFCIWALPILSRGLRAWYELAHGSPDTRLALGVLSGFTLAVWTLFFCFTYGLGVDLTRSPRYHFVYFPVMIALLGSSLAACWSASRSSSKKGLTPGKGQPVRPSRTGGKPAVALILLMGLFSALTIVSNLGYQRYERPGLMVDRIQAVSKAPVLIATTHQTHGQTGSMIGLAWEFKHRHATSPQFLLAHQHNPRAATATLQRALSGMPRLDLWLVKFEAPVELASQNCSADSQPPEPSWVTGYDYQLYHCRGHRSRDAPSSRAKLK